MGDAHYMKQGTTRPTLQRTVVNEDGDPIDLTGNLGVLFTMARVPGQPKVTAAGAVLGDPTLGRVEYAWTAADSDTPGDFEGFFAVTLAGGDVVSYPPKDDYLLVRISPDLVTAP